MSLDWHVDRESTALQSSYNGSQCHWIDSSTYCVDGVNSWTSENASDFSNPINPNQYPDQCVVPQTGAIGGGASFCQGESAVDASSRRGQGKVSITIDPLTWRRFLIAYNRVYFAPSFPHPWYRSVQRRPPLLRLPPQPTLHGPFAVGQGCPRPRKRSNAEARPVGRQERRRLAGRRAGIPASHRRHDWRAEGEAREHTTDGGSAEGAKRIRYVLGRFDEWPSELKDYCKEVYRACGKSQASIEKAHKFLLRIIEDHVEKAHSSADLHSIRWLSLPFPDFLKPPSTDTRAARRTADATRHSRSLKRSETEDESDDGDGGIAARTPVLGSIVRLPSPPASTQRNPAIQIPVQCNDESPALPLNPEMVKKRIKKFGNVQMSGNEVNQRASPLISNEEVKMDMTHEIQGLCTELEKNYLRLTSAPDAATIRPLAVLEQAFEHVCEKAKTKDARYLCDQLRSIRQDLTVQNVKTDFTVRVYETNAMLALQAYDREEFNQCQSRLMELYEQGFESVNRCKFTGFRLLYCLFTKDSQSIMECYGDILKLDFQGRLASVVSLFKGWTSRNYLLMFRSYHSLSGTDFQMVADLFVEREQTLAVAQFIKAFRPTLSLNWISSILRVPDTGDILKSCNSLNAIFSAATDRMLIDCKTSAVKINQKAL